MRPTVRSLAALMMLALVAGACGGDDDRTGATSQGEQGFELTGRVIDVLEMEASGFTAPGAQGAASTDPARPGYNSATPFAPNEGDQDTGPEGPPGDPDSMAGGNAAGDQGDAGTDEGRAGDAVTDDPGGALGGQTPVAAVALGVTDITSSPQDCGVGQGTSVVVVLGSTVRMPAGAESDVTALEGQEVTIRGDVVRAAGECVFMAREIGEMGASPQGSPTNGAGTGTMSPTPTQTASPGMTASP